MIEKGMARFKSVQAFENYITFFKDKKFNAFRERLKPLMIPERKFENLFDKKLHSTYLRNVFQDSDWDEHYLKDIIKDLTKK